MTEDEQGKEKLDFLVKRNALSINLMNIYHAPNVYIVLSFNLNRNKQN